MNERFKTDHQIRSLDEIYQIATGLVEKHGPYTIAVAAGEDIMGIGGLALGKERGIIEPILVGHPDHIRQSFFELGLSLQGWNVIEEKDDIAATQIAAKMVSEGEADILMRGKLLARDFMKALLDKKSGIKRNGALWTNVVVTKIEKLDRLLFVTDCAVIVNADIATRLKQIQEVIEFAAFLGVTEPKVALLAAVETVSLSMPVSMEEAIIAKMCERGQFPRNIQVDGPLSLDLSINPEAVAKKGFKGKVAGNADILSVNNLKIGNLLFKSLITLCGGNSASTIIGLPFPVVLTSRSESPENILYSFALSILMAGPKE